MPRVAKLTGPGLPYIHSFIHSFIHLGSTLHKHKHTPTTTPPATPCIGNNELPIPVTSICCKHGGPTTDCLCWHFIHAWLMMMNFTKLELPNLAQQVWMRQGILLPGKCLHYDLLLCKKEHVCRPLMPAW